MYFRVILSLLEAPGMHKGRLILGEIMLLIIRND